MWSGISGEQEVSILFCTILYISGECWVTPIIHGGFPCVTGLLGKLTIIKEWLSDLEDLAKSAIKQE